LPGALTATIGMTSLVYGLSRVPSSGWTDNVTILALVVAVVLLVVFVNIERLSRHALMPLHIFHERNRAGSYAVMLCLAAAMFTTFFFITQFVQDILGYSPLKAGVAFLPMTIGIAVTANVVSRLVMRVGTRGPMTIGPVLVALGLFWLSFVGVGSTYLSVIGPLVVVAIGMGSTFVPLTLTVMSRVVPHEAGLASALLNTAQQVGGALGLAVLVTVAATVRSHHLAAGAAVPSATASGYEAAFRIASVIALGAFVIAASVIRGGARSAPVAQPEPEPEVSAA
jgi:predicted MFS family arabinose efflux permease